MGIRNFKEKMGAVINCSPSTETTTVDRVANFLNVCAVFLIGIFLLSAPYPHLTAIKEITYYTSVTFFIFLILHRKSDVSFNTPLTFPFAVFSLWAILSIFFAINKGNSSHDVYAHLLKYIVFYFMLINFFNTRKRFLALTWIMIIATTIICLGGFIYFYIILGHKLWARFLITPPDFFIPYLDYLYIFTIFLSLNHLLTSWDRGGKYLSIAPLLIISLGAVLSQTRSAIFAFMVSSFFYFHKRLKIWILATVLLLAVAAVILLANDRLTDFKTFLHNERFDNARIYIEMIKDHPITGIGFGMQSYDDMNLLMYYYKKFPVDDRPNRSNMFFSPHNLLLDITVRLGIVGLILFGFLIFRFLRMGWQTIRQGKDDFIRGWGSCIMACFIAFFVQALFGDAGFGIQAIVMYTIFAMMTVLWQLQRSSDTVPGEQSSPGSATRA